MTRLSHSALDRTGLESFVEVYRILKNPDMELELLAITKSPWAPTVRDKMRPDRNTAAG